jgi:mannose-6-phosphate isomerase
MSRIVFKPWGQETLWAETKSYVGKVLHIKAGHKLSRQYHIKKDETFLIQGGEMLLELGFSESSFEKDKPQSIVMKPGDSYHCAPGTIHRMIAITDTDVIEVSTPELDDVVRLEDDYGREGTKTP